MVAYFWSPFLTLNETKGTDTEEPTPRKEETAV